MKSDFHPPACREARSFQRIYYSMQNTGSFAFPGNGRFEKNIFSTGSGFIAGKLNYSRLRKEEGYIRRRGEAFRHHPTHCG